MARNTAQTLRDWYLDLCRRIGPVQALVEIQAQLVDRFSEGFREGVRIADAKQEESSRGSDQEGHQSGR